MLRRAFGSITPRVKEHLSSLGYHDSKVQKAVVSALENGGIRGESDILSFPASGLEAMVGAIEANAVDGGGSCCIQVEVPHHRTSFSVATNDGLSILEAAGGDEVLGEYIVGSCQGTMSCSTCHVLLTDPEQYERALEGKDEVGEDEMDMLDLAHGYTEGKSRLGCQVKCYEGLKVEIPDGTNDYWG